MRLKFFDSVTLGSVILEPRSGDRITIGARMTILIRASYRSGECAQQLQIVLSLLPKGDNSTKAINCQVSYSSSTIKVSYHLILFYLLVRILQLSPCWGPWCRGLRSRWSQSSRRSRARARKSGRFRRRSRRGRTSTRRW